MPAAWDTSRAGLPTVFFGRDTFAGAQRPLLGERRQRQHAASRCGTTGARRCVVGPRDVGQGRGVLGVDAQQRRRRAAPTSCSRPTATPARKMPRSGRSPRDTRAHAPRHQQGRRSERRPGLEARSTSPSPRPTWVRREVRVFVPPRTNVLVVRCGLFGTGQVMFDDASLTLEPALPPRRRSRWATNLLADSGLRGQRRRLGVLAAALRRACAVRTRHHWSHGGRESVRFDAANQGRVEARAGVVPGDRQSQARRQARPPHGLGQDRQPARDRPTSRSTVTTHDGDVHESAPRQFGGSTPWTEAAIEMDVRTPTRSG